MQVIPEKFSPPLYAILRIVSGLLFLMHGTKKFFGWPGGGNPVELVSLYGLAGIIEIVAGAMIMVGFFTSLAAFISSGQMAVAYFIAHIPRGFWPLENGGEPAALFAFIFLYMAAMGSGIWSVDAAMGRGTKAKRA
ncbi:MAG TPA: DoxX family protein [Thermoanaerobaculia bacterium]|nr:DoxX family protein [Thermoanaerobaculia bacterium]